MLTRRAEVRLFCVHFCKLGYGILLERVFFTVKGMVNLIRAYKLDERLQDIFEDIRMYRADVESIEESDHVDILRDEYENYVKEKLGLLDMGYREIVREGTTTFVFLLAESEESELEEVKITLRFREGVYVSQDFKNFTFDRDLEYYVEQIEEERLHNDSGGRLSDGDGDTEE